MMTVYDYDKDNVSDTLLSQEIIAQFLIDDPSVLAIFEGTLNTGEATPTENLHIEFTTPLSGGNKAILDAVVAAHPNTGSPPAPVTVYGENTGAWFFRKSYTKDADKPYVGSNKSSYKTVTIFDFPGTDAGANPNKVIAAVSSKSGDGTVGIRIVDITNAQVIAEVAELSVLEDEPASYNIGSVSNLPTGPAIFEIQIKKGSKKCLLHDILIERA